VHPSMPSGHNFQGPELLGAGFIPRSVCGEKSKN